MRIIHTPIEIAGQVSLSVAGLRALGVTAHAAVEPHPFAYGQAPEVVLPVGMSQEVVRQRVELSLHLSKQYEVFHYHFAQSMLPESLEYVDAFLNAVAGKKCIVQFWGTDVRIPEIEFKRNPYFKVLKGENGDVAKRRMELWSKITNGHVIVADGWFTAMVEPYFDHIHYVKQAVDVDSLHPIYPDPEVEIPRVVHIPSHRGFKGTEFIRDAVEKLKAKGYTFEYKEISGVTHAEALKLCSTADLVVDQLRGCSHGVFALEAMALGKPVLTYLSDWMLEWYPKDLPIIPTNQDRLEKDLTFWLHSSKERSDKGVQSRSYVEKYHNYKSISRDILGVYKLL